MADKGTKSQNLLTVVSVAIIIGVEVFAAAIAAGWALAGLFELGDVVGYGLMALFSALGAWGMWKFVRNAASIEPVR